MNKGQVSLFVIIAVVLVAAVLLFFSFRLGIVPGVGQKAGEDPHKFFSSCVEEDLQETLEIMGKRGGYVENPLNIEFQFSDEKEPTKISYLCYTRNNYVACINQEPLLIQHLKSEIEGNIGEIVRECFNDLTTSLEREGYVVEAEFSGFDVLLNLGQVIIQTNSKLTLTKSGESSSIENFKVLYPSKFYDLAVVVQEIVHQEGRFCNFEHLGYMLIYPEFEIDKFRTSTLDIIYTVRHRKSEEMFRFAIRGCVLPPGL